MVWFDELFFVRARLRLRCKQECLGLLVVTKNSSLNGFNITNPDIQTKNYSSYLIPAVQVARTALHNSKMLRTSAFYWQ
jgi:hypothetical protein